MNTPPRIKRWSPEFDPNRGPPTGAYIYGLENAEYAARVGQITTHFAHLEEAMSMVLAVLLQTHHDQIASQVLRAIKSPRGRIDLMWDLLQLAPQNRDIPTEYDRIIREFSSINGRRNAYVHGLWWTEANTREVYLAESNEDGFGFNTARPVPLAELDELRVRISELNYAIIRGPYDDLRQIQSRQSRLEQHAPPNL